MPKTDQEHRGPDTPACCDSCRSYGPPSMMEQTTLAGYAVTMCANAMLCRRRAEAAGIWAVYP